MKIFLIGFMGSGKSKLGLALAKKLKYRYIEMDELIETMTDRSIKEWIVIDGEEKFQEIEKETILKLKNEDKLVVNVNGSSPCTEGIMDTLNEMGETVYIKREYNELLKSWLDLKPTRPLLWGKTEEVISNYISTALEEREQFYQKSKHTLEGKAIVLNSFKKLLKL